MRYKLSENTYILGRFPSGSTVTITLYDLSDNSIVSLSSNACQEVGTTGIFKWTTANIASQPTTKKEYLWVMSDGVVSSSGKIVLGGYPDNIDAKISEVGGKKIKYIVDGELPIYED